MRKLVAVLTAVVLIPLMFDAAFGARFDPSARPPTFGAERDARLALSADAQARSAPLATVGTAGTAVARLPAPAALDTSSVPAEPAPGAGLVSSGCPDEMVLVEGDYCRDVRQDCIRWLDDPSLPFARCREYAQPSRCTGPRVRLRFCIDRQEYTRPGEALPQNYASFEIAKKTCEGLGKRICTEAEWNFACEGEEMRPYPYGFERKAVCNQDRSDLFENDPHRQVLRDLRNPSAANTACMSPFGVLDMVGNMDEPVFREEARNNAPFRNALKGGWWMPARNRCRPATTAHDDYYKDIQVGIRCCEPAE